MTTTFSFIEYQHTVHEHKSLPDHPLSSSRIKERSRIMTDGQPLKERREAEKAELFQGTGQESHAGKENVV